jgi:hypothetical protein
MRIIGPKKLTKRAEFVANLLDIKPAITLSWAKEEGDFSYCIENDDASFNMEIQKWLKGEDLIKTIGHEMVHVWQHKRGDLVSFHNEFRWFWKGQMYVGTENNMEEYFLRPWELEARALEDWIAWRWRNR